MVSQPRKEIQLRLRLHDQAAQDLEKLTRLGNFRNPGAAAEHIVNCFVGSMVKGLLRAQLAVEQSPDDFLHPLEKS